MKKILLTLMTLLVSSYSYGNAHQADQCNEQTLAAIEGNDLIVITRINSSALVIRDVLAYTISEMNEAPLASDINASFFSEAATGEAFKVLSDKAKQTGRFEAYLKVNAMMLDKYEEIRPCVEAIAAKNRSR